MQKYLFVYHGGAMPETPEEGERVMAAWGAWYAELGSAIVDGGNPVGRVATVAPDGSAAEGAPNPVTGYTIVEASSFEQALAMAAECPVLMAGGSVEVGETFEIM